MSKNTRLEYEVVADDAARPAGCREWCAGVRRIRTVARQFLRLRWASATLEALAEIGDPGSGSLVALLRGVEA